MNISIQRLTENSLIVKLVIETENNYYIVAISLQMLLSKYTEHFYTIHVPCVFPTIAIVWFTFGNQKFLNLFEFLYSDFKERRKQANKSQKIIRFYYL